MTGLVKYEAARAALSVAVKVDEVKDIRDKSQAMASYAKQARDTVLMQLAAEIKVRAERKAGQMLSEMEKSKGAATRSHDVTALPKTLSDLGIQKMESHRWQQIASIEEVVFEKTIADAAKNGVAITSAAMVRAAKVSDSVHAAPTVKATTLPDLPEVKPAFTTPDDDTPEIMRGYNLADEADTLEQMLADAHRENEVLRQQVEAMTADETGKELEKQIRMRVGIEARLKQEMTKNKALTNELTYFGNLTRNVRNALGVADNRAIVPAIKAMAKSSFTAQFARATP